MLAGIYSMMNDDINVMQKIVFANPRLKVLVMEDACTLRGRRLCLIFLPDRLPSSLYSARQNSA